MSLPSSRDLAGHRAFGADAVARVRGMFIEMPGTEWTVTDAARLAGLETAICREILETLEDTGFLSRRGNGAFVRCMTQAPQPTTLGALTADA